LSGERIARASLAVADFNGDGYKEIVAAGQDGMLYVVAYNGSTWSVVWERQMAADLNAAGPPHPTSTTEIQSSPAVADLDGDGSVEIIVTTGGDPGHHKNGGVLVYTCNSAWSFSVVSGWPQPKLDIVGGGAGASNPDGYWDGINGSPALGDLDGDGDLEIAVEGFDRRLHAWHHDGTVVDGWPISRDNGDALLRGGWSSPAIGDIDGDGLPEVVFGTDSPVWEGEGSMPDYSQATVWAVNGDSSNVPGFPRPTDQAIQSPPALGDIDGDGALEIVVGTGDGISGSGGHKVYAWNGDGTTVDGWPQTTLENMPAPPALGDIDGDGDLEVVIGCGNGSGNCKYLYAWSGDGTSVSGFPMRPVGFNFWIDELYHDPVYSAVLADYDGDGTVEIMIALAGSWGITIVEPNGTTNPDQSRETNADLMAAPVIDDIDNDGKLETLIGGADSSGAHGEITIWDEVGTTNHALPWPTFHRDMWRTGSALGGALAPPASAASSPSFAVNQISVSWVGGGASASSLASYDVQVREGTGGTWTTWLDDVTCTQFTYTDTVAGQTYFFRSVARDIFGNVETPPEEGDTSTRVTAYAFTGHVFNNREGPVYGAQVQPTPAMLSAQPSDPEGAYELFFDDVDTYQLMVQRSGFGTLPSKYVSGGSVSGLDFYLPPASDFIVDGNFELGSGTLGTSAWEFQGPTVPTLTGVTHTGSRALLIQGPGTSVVSQTLTLPGDLDADSLTLSWMASVTGTVTAQDVLTVEGEVDGLVHASSVSLTDMTLGDWVHGYLDVNVQASQVVTVRLALGATSGALLYFDEISLGETRQGVHLVYLPIALRDS